MSDGKIDPLEGLNSPVGLGTLSAVIALTRVVQALAGKDSDLVERTLHGALESNAFKGGDQLARTNFEAPIRQAIAMAKQTREELNK